MIHYKFPAIKTLKDIESVLKKPEFILVKKDGYQVVNYIYNDLNTFETPLDAECRGLIFDMEGNLISRRYHKFFNMGERNDSVPDLETPHVILEKLDGSMVSPLLIKTSQVHDEATYSLRWTTKMGITDTSMQVEEYIQELENKGDYSYNNLIMYLHPFHTPIFEWCSRKNKVVLDYPEDKLVLTAIRNNTDGTYASYMDMCRLAGNIPVVKRYEGTLFSVKALEGQEGVVLRFEDGHMVKIKSDWYVRLHKTKDAISNEAKVLTLILDEGLDDLIPLLSDVDKEVVLEYQDKFYKHLIESAEAYAGVYNRWKSMSTTRAEFASYAKSAKYPDIFFKMYDGERTDIAIVNKIKKSMKKLNEVRDLIGVSYKDKEYE